MGDEYEMYVHRKWIENCLERDAWGEPVLQKADYVSENIEWLRNSFYSDMRVDKDGFLNLC